MSTIVDFWDRASEYGMGLLNLGMGAAENTRQTGIQEHQYRQNMEWSKYQFHKKDWFAKEQWKDYKQNRERNWNEGLQNEINNARAAGISPLVALGKTPYMAPGTVSGPGSSPLPNQGSPSIQRARFTNDRGMQAIQVGIAQQQLEQQKLITKRMEAEGQVDRDPFGLEKGNILAQDLQTGRKTIIPSRTLGIESGYPSKEQMFVDKKGRIIHTPSEAYKNSVEDMMSAQAKDIWYSVGDASGRAAFRLNYAYQHNPTAQRKAKLFVDFVKKIRPKEFPLGKSSKTHEWQFMILTGDFILKKKQNKMFEGTALKVYNYNGQNTGKRRKK